MNQEKLAADIFSKQQQQKKKNAIMMHKLDFRSYIFPINLQLIPKNDGCCSKIKEFRKTSAAKQKWQKSQSS